MRCFSFKLIGRGSASAKGGAPALPTSVKLQQLKSISKLYRQLLGNCAPISQWHSPFLAYVAISEVDKLLKGGVIREHALVFCNFPYLTVVAFNGIRRINHTTYIGCELEVFSELFPVVLPRLDDDRIFLSPFLI